MNEQQPPNEDAPPAAGLTPPGPEPSVPAPDAAPATVVQEVESPLNPVEVASETSGDDSGTVVPIVDADTLSDGHLKLGEGGWSGSPAWASMVRWFLLVAVATALALFSLNLWVDPNGISGSKRFRVQTVEGSVRAAKAQLLEKMDAAPEVVVLGSSTSRMADPETIRVLTGGTAFNAGMSAGRPADMFAITSYVLNRWVTTPPHFVYLIDVDGTFRDTPANAGLMTTPELWKQFGAVDKARIMLDAYRPYMSKDAVELSLKVLRSRQPYDPSVEDVTAKFRPDGRVKRDPYANPNEQRRLKTAERRRIVETARYRDTIYGNEGAERLDPRGRDYVDRIVRLIHQAGGTPTLVLLPGHPDYVREMKPYGYERRRDAVLKLLRSYQDAGQAKVIDLSDLNTFGGDPDEFSDNVHMTSENMDRMFRELSDLELLLAPLPTVKPAENAKGF
jgi:hypothetical protein